MELLNEILVGVFKHVPIESLLVSKMWYEELLDECKILMTRKVWDIFYARYFTFYITNIIKNIVGMSITNDENYHGMLDEIYEDGIEAYFEYMCFAERRWDFTFKDLCEKHSDMKYKNRQVKINYYGYKLEFDENDIYFLRDNLENDSKLYDKYKERCVFLTNKYVELFF